MNIQSILPCDRSVSKRITLNEQLFFGDFLPGRKSKIVPLLANAVC
jgi:hypothetical protein